MRRWLAPGRRPGGFALWKYQCSPHAQGGDYGNALQAASYRGHDQVVQLLLDKEANINVQGGRYSNALQAASSKGYDAA